MGRKSCIPFLAKEFIDIAMRLNSKSKMADFMKI